jgi:uncharacterized membrane protein
MVTLSILRHDAFASRFDLSNMDQTLWYTLNGHFFQFRHPDDFVSRFSVHADLILVLLSPLYLIWDDVRMLIASESVFLGSGAIAVYLISSIILKNKIISLILAAVYLLNPGMQWTDIYDFHGVSLAIPFVLASFYFLLTKKKRWYWVFVFLALITKENVSLTISMLGILAFFVYKERRLGFLTFVVGVLWFVAMVSFVMPYFSPSGTHWALEESGETGPAPLAGIFEKNMNIETFTNTFLFNQTALDYYLLLIRPFGFLPILGVPFLLVSVPEMAINILRGTTTIVFHYDSATMPGLVLATVYGLWYIKLLFQKVYFLRKFERAGMYLITGVLLLYVLRVNYQYSPLPTTPWCQCYVYNAIKEDREFEAVLQSLPRDAFITSSLEIRPHVSHRDLAFTVPSATESAKYIALITQNRLISNYEPKEYENQLIPILLASPEHKLNFKSKHFYLFERL